MTIYCKQCGKDLKQEQTFCTHCGAAKEQTYGPFLPSEHTVKAIYKGKYANVTDQKDLDPKADAADHNLYADLDLTGDHVTIYSDYDDAIVYVNGKSTGKRAGNITEFGPVETDGSTKISAKLKLPSVTVKSNEVAIHEPDQEVELSFHNLPLDQEAGGTESEMDSAYTASYLKNVVHPTMPIFQAKIMKVPMICFPLIGNRK